MASRAALLLFAVLASAACAYRGPAEPANLPAQRATFFSWLGGEDIRAACAAGTADRYRMIYNADFNEQVRGYEIVPAAGGGGTLFQTVDRGLVLDGPVDLMRPLSIGAPVRVETPLSPEDMAAAAALLQASGAFDAPPVGLRLRSQEHFWVVSGCRDGRFFLTAYRYPSDRFDGIRFAEFLAAHDATGIPFPAPASPLGGHLSRCPDSRSRGYVCFTRQVGADGLVGWGSLL